MIKRGIYIFIAELQYVKILEISFFFIFLYFLSVKKRKAQLLKTRKRAVVDSAEIMRIKSRHRNLLRHPNQSLSLGFSLNINYVH